MSGDADPAGGRSAGKWAVLLVVWAIGLVVWPVYIGLLVWLLVRVFG